MSDEAKAFASLNLRTQTTGGDGVSDKTDKFWAENHFLARQKYEKLSEQRLQSLNVWKRAATKYWRKDYYDVNRMDIKELDETATRRLELLRRWDEYRISRERPCPFCFEINHTGFCELAEELGDD